MSSQLDRTLVVTTPRPTPRNRPISTRRMPARPRRVPDRPTSIRLWLPSLSFRWRDRSTTPVNGRTMGPRRSSHP